MFVTPKCPRKIHCFSGRSVTARSIPRAASLIERRLSHFKPRDAPDKGYEAFDELLKLVLCACEPAGSVEGAPGMGHEEASTVPGHRPQGPQDRQPCVLAEDRAKATRVTPQVSPPAFRQPEIPISFVTTGPTVNTWWYNSETEFLMAWRASGLFTNIIRQR
jgi:hypothetical protein